MPHQTEQQRLQAMIDNLQERLVFQDDLIQQLNDVVVQQSASIADTQKQLRWLSEVVTSLREEQHLGAAKSNLPGDDPPPHY